MNETLKQIALDAGAIGAATREQILSANPDLLTRIPVDSYIGSLERLGTCTNYWQRTSEVDAWCRDIITWAGKETLKSYHKLVLLTLIQNFESRVRTNQYPESVLAMIARQFRYILTDIQTKHAGIYLHDDDSFCKDLAVCMQRLIPCGVQLLEISGVPRSWLVRGGIRQTAGLTRLMIQKLGSFRPMYDMHMDRRFALLDFNPDGWKKCYLRIADLLKLNAHIRGVFGSSWWFDPQLAEVSPRLLFLQKLPGDHGAKCFFLGEDEQSTRDALVNSSERQRRYAEGSYKPKKHAMVWAREDLIDWAHSVASSTTA